MSEGSQRRFVRPDKVRELSEAHTAKEVREHNKLRRQEYKKEQARLAEGDECGNCGAVVSLGQSCECAGGTEGSGDWDDTSVQS